MRKSLMLVTAAAMAACGSSHTPSAPAVYFLLTANPMQVTGALCTGCGAGSSEKEALTTLMIQEAAGLSGAVTLIDMSLRETGTNAVIGAGSFDGPAVARLAGTNRFAAHGTLNVTCGVHYPPSVTGRTAVLTYVVTVTEDNGPQTSSTITVNVTT
jgi:hypothetical protein